MKQGSTTLQIQNISNISHPLYIFICQQNDAELYHELIFSIYQIWTNSQKLQCKNRSVIWMNILHAINQFIYDSKTNQINFKRCLEAGSLIFSLNANKKYIFLKISYFQNLFQYISPIPSRSTISKRIGIRSQIDFKQIPLVNEFLMFLKNIYNEYPNTQCNCDWSLYEFDFEIDKIYKPLLKDYSIHKKILDLIIDDDQIIFEDLLSQFLNESTDINQQISIIDYKLPVLISDYPPISCLCVFFQARKCFSTLFNFISNGLPRDQMFKKDYRGRSLLHFASFTGNMEIINFVYQNDDDLNISDNNGLTSCHYASMGGHLEVLKFLIYNGINVLTFDKLYMTSYDYACIYGYIHIIDFLDKQLKCNGIGFFKFNDECNYTPLSFACQNDNVDIVQYFLNKINSIENPNLISSDNVLSTFTSAFENSATKSVKCLFKNRFDRYLADDKKNRLLIDAIILSDESVIKIVLSFMKLDMCNEILLFQGLKIAINMNKYSVITFLIQNGAVINEDEQSIANLFLLAFKNMRLYVLLDKLINIPYKSNGKLFMKYACSLKDEKLVLFLLNKYCGNSSDISFLQYLKDRLLNMSNTFKTKQKSNEDAYEMLEQSFNETQLNHKECIESKKGLNIENMDQREHDHFSKLAKLKWEKENSKKKKTLVMNTPQIVECVNYITYKGVSTQTEISSFSPQLQKNTLNSLFQIKLSISLIWEMLEKCFKSQRRYSNQLYDISMLLYLSSAKTYAVIRQFFPIPAVKNLYAVYGDMISSEKRNLLDFSEKDNVIDEYLHQNEIDFNSPQTSNIITLGIDAFSFQSFSSTALSPSKKFSSGDQTITYNNGFLFLLTPIDFTLPPKIFHLEKASNGNYNDDIDIIAKKLIDVLKRKGFNVWFKCTDGDRFLSPQHEDFYRKYIYQKSNNFLKIVNDVHTKLCDCPDFIVPTGDPLHLWKDLRRRFQQHVIALFSNSPLATDFERAKSILNVGKALNDTSDVGKMRDIYCIQLFTLENVYKLLDNDDYMDATLFFPYACWIIVVYSIQIDLEFRLFLTELSFQFIQTFLDNFPTLKQNRVLQKSRDDVDFVTIAEEQYLIRMLNTLVATAIVLIYSPRFVRMDGVGTHLVENNIGIARQTSNDPRWDRIVITFSHAELRKKIAKKYNIKLHVQGRINDGGCKLDQIEDSQEKTNNLISKPKSWSVPEIIQLFIGLCNPETSGALQKDLHAFMMDLKSLGNLIDIKNPNFNDTANNGIVARLISFKAKIYSDDTDE